MKLAVLGGSFNPIHVGHLHLADSVLEAFGFDRLLLVPASISPFKEKQTAIASSADRLDMILASITGNPGIAVEDMELIRGGVSYTVDTIKEIINRYHPEGKPGLILGDDLIADFSKWKDAEELTGIADIIIARRMTNSTGPEFPYPHRKLNNKTMDISSAMIRERIAKSNVDSNAWHYLVPRGARLIIKDRGLYSEGPKNTSRTDDCSGSAITNELIAQVEDAARAALSARRFIHSRNTALMARDLALRYGLDANSAYLAGIAHDMTKNKSSDLSHGKSAAVLLQKRFGIHNKDVLEAIEVHTTGRPHMGDLAKAVFIADKIEFSRTNAKSSLREMASGKTCSLDELFYAVLNNNVKWLEETGIKTAEETLLLQKTAPTQAGDQ